MRESHSELSRLVVERLVEMGFTINEDGSLAPPHGDKDAIRNLHRPARQLELSARRAWLNSRLPRYLPLFANGSEVEPQFMRPRLVEVATRKQHELFRVARLLWSIPFAKGFGRRLRFFVMDECNGKLVGLLALQSPPLSFPPRDRLFEYPPARKTELVNQTMDIQTLGAVPPYNRLLGGKLVALAAASNEVREAYRRKYKGEKTEMQGRVLPAHLVALTTTSAFGRSSLYNRLRYGSTTIAEPIGYTVGYGSFHLMEFYPQFRDFLESQGISTRGGFGTGPRIKWQTMVRALERLGLSRRLLRHGVRREAFLFRLADNLTDYMQGADGTPRHRDLPFDDLATFWRERWLLPRAHRVDGWRGWRREQITEALMLWDEANSDVPTG
jgi:hypothetical protein